MRKRLAITEDRFRWLTYVSLAALTLIVFTGALVRLTDSGLGCEHWPRCYGHIYPPVALHPLIEFGNRALSGFVGVVCGAVAVASLLLKPRRLDLILLSWLLPLGIVAQAVLGGYTVLYKLAPGFVMSHFLLSMVVLVDAFALAWRATHKRGWRSPATDPLLVWGMRFLALMTAVTVFAGTAATAAGPHSGGLIGQKVKRLMIKGPDTLEWAVHQHATIAALLGVMTIGMWLLKRRKSPVDPTEPITILAILMAAQGLVGSAQYELKLPGEMVWVHVALATLSWLVAIWAVAVEGRLAKRSVRKAAKAGGSPAGKSTLAADGAAPGAGSSATAEAELEQLTR